MFAKDMSEDQGRNAISRKFLEVIDEEVARLDTRMDLARGHRDSGLGKWTNTLQRIE